MKILVVESTELKADEAGSFPALCGFEIHEGVGGEIGAVEVLP